MNKVFCKKLILDEELEKVVGGVDVIIPAGPFAGLTPPFGDGSVSVCEATAHCGGGGASVSVCEATANCGGGGGVSVSVCEATAGC